MKPGTSRNYSITSVSSFFSIPPEVENEGKIRNFHACSQREDFFLAERSDREPGETVRK